MRNEKKSSRHFGFAERPSKRRTAQRRKFALGFTLYMLFLFWVVLLGLALLWRRMESYERSRPEPSMEALLAGADHTYWREFLLVQGVSERFINQLDLDEVSFYKRMDLYTDETPVFGVRFGAEDMLLVHLRVGEEISFGDHLWEVASMETADSGLCVYVPQGAVIRIDGEAIDGDCLVAENAKELNLGIFDRNREDIVGLSKYEINHSYDTEGLTVTDSEGNVLDMSYCVGNSCYYAPLMEDYRILVPSGSIVTVNGILLTEKNARIETVSDEDFEGIEDFIPFVPGWDRYHVEGLILPPEVKAETNNGKQLECTVRGGEYQCERKDEIPEDFSDYVMTVFDAYIAYSGNRNGALSENYERYLSFLVPGSEAAERAAMAQRSLKWVNDRDTRLKDAEIAEYTSYSDTLAACRIRFTLSGDDRENANGYLFIFVRDKGEWKVVRILNKTAFITLSHGTAEMSPNSMAAYAAVLCRVPRK